MAESDERTQTDTWGQHWIEPAEKVRTANLALASMQGSEARWWRYTVSHCSFEMIVGNASTENNIVLSLSACEHLAGPVGWLDQRLEVSFQPDPSFPKSGIYTLEDKTAQFRAVGRVFRWKRGWDMWAHDGLYLGRGGDARFGLKLEQVLGRIEEQLREYYAGKVNYSALERGIEMALWHTLPLVRRSRPASEEF